MNTAVRDLAAIGVPAFAAVVFLLLALSAEIGLRLGLRHGRRDNAPREGVGLVVGGMLGLLAFLLALTLSNSSARFQDRREGAVAEANAIGTAWLRAQAIGGPRGNEIARLLEDYTRLRMEFIGAGNDRRVIEGINDRTSAMQTVMWGHAAAIVRERPDAVAASLMASLNDTFDLATSERFAFALGVPPILFWLLMGMSVISTGGMGYQLGLRGQQPRVLAVLLIAMWAGIITLILDLGAPRLGDIRVGTTVYEWTLKSFQGGVPIPPLP